MTDCEKRQAYFERVCADEGVKVEVFRELCAAPDSFRVRVTFKAGALEVGNIYSALRRVGIPMRKAEALAGVAGFDVQPCSRDTCRRGDCEQTCG